MGSNSVPRYCTITILPCYPLLFSIATYLLTYLGRVVGGDGDGDRALDAIPLGVDADMHCEMTPVLSLQAVSFIKYDGPCTHLI